ncbi:ABC transporter G family member 20-like [Sipha flava]|uniref:ABC transporter G family member 20-like n=1 Tax=Sipha flava TaxID=143950 RepID=A0A8B8FTY6_9HEMI|nr:ABC transporter G family member 20-like [Sipha flava]
MFYSALWINREIQNGYMMRNIVAGVTIYEIILSFFITHSIFSILQAFSFFFLVEFFLDIIWRSSLLLIILINIGVGICGMSIGLMIGVFVDSEVKIFLTILIVYFENVIVTGLFWPLVSTSALKLLALISPLYLPLKTAEEQLISGRNDEFKIIYVIEMRIEKILESYMFGTNDVLESSVR